jgi:hypothetical protein
MQRIAGVACGVTSHCGATTPEWATVAPIFDPSLIRIPHSLLPRAGAGEGGHCILATIRLVVSVSLCSDICRYVQMVSGAPLIWRGF